MYKIYFDKDNIYYVGSKEDCLEYWDSFGPFADSLFMGEATAEEFRSWELAEQSH